MGLYPHAVHAQVATYEQVLDLMRFLLERHHFLMDRCANSAVPFLPSSLPSIRPHKQAHSLLAQAAELHIPGVQLSFGILMLAIERFDLGFEFLDQCVPRFYSATGVVSTNWGSGPGTQLGFDAFEFIGSFFQSGRQFWNASLPLLKLLLQRLYRRIFHC